jgi:hypothetical protein
MRSTLTTLGLALALGQACLIAQAPPRAEAQQPPQPQPPARQTFRFNFPGGELSTLVKELSNAGGTEINIIIPDNTPEIIVPALSLSNVTSGDVMKAIRLVLQNRRDIALTQTGDNVWVVLTAQIKRESRVFNIGAILHGDGRKLSIDAVTTAIRTAWELQSSTGGQMKYHPDTGLLFVLGDAEELKAVTEVLRELSVPVNVDRQAGGEEGRRERKRSSEGVFE